MTKKEKETFKAIGKISRELMGEARKISEVLGDVPIAETIHSKSSLILQVILGMGFKLD